VTRHVTRAFPVTRRAVVGGLTFAGLGLAAARADDERPARLRRELARLDKESGGRLGVAVLDTGTGALAGQREHERFPLCSTFKFLAAAAVLARVDAGQDRLDRASPFGPSDLVSYSPVTAPRVGEGSMSLAQLCEAAMIVSDNTAGNLILDTLGGPAGITAFARRLGDETTRLDRIEPHLNEAIPGDPRDTTTPAAMLGTLRALLVGDALSPASRERLLQWLFDNKTGDARLRAGIPKDWRVGEKTGSGENGTTNDVGLVIPPGRPPILVAAYQTESSAPAEQRNAVLADVGRAVAALAA
jgi:beta-lactamase class A